MTAPKVLRRQVEALERLGFRAVSFEARKGSHFMVAFEGVPGRMVLSPIPEGDQRALKNRVADLRRRRAQGLVGSR